MTSPGGSWVLAGGRVVDPAGGLDGRLDVRIAAGRIVDVGSGLSAAGAEIVDVRGCIVCPGFIDMHVHLREPGQEAKETIASGTRAAARGGFTAVACMPNTDPVNDCRAVTERILARAAAAGTVRVHPVACVTRGQRGTELVEMEELVDAGARAFSDDGRAVGSSLVMRRALERAARLGVPVIDHCEDHALVDGGVVNEGEISLRLDLAGWPSAAEDLVVARDVLLAEYTRADVHVAHLSTGRSIELVREGKRRGVRVTCEVTPHHLLLTEAAVADGDTNAKMNPPLRREEDRRALLAALADGTVDAIATDHAPHRAEEKGLPFARAPFGVVGLETAVSLCLDRLVRLEVVDLTRLVELFTAGPARVLRLTDAGTLAEGAPADLTVLDLDRHVVVDPRRFVSRSRNTPFAGWELRGAPVMTVVAGRIVHDDRLPARAG
jgi:dihydroorotase